MMKKEKLPTESYKGVRDFYPEDQAFLNYVMATMREVSERFGYEEYHASILEPAELYRSKGAENAEMVNEQTYTFLDRGEREVTLRPEMTPTVARMVAARRREMGFPLRLYSIPNVFRYERPQKGRLREHWQLNVDLFGSRSPGADAEVIAVASNLMRAFGASNNDFVIKIGSRTFLRDIIARYELDEAGAKALRSHLDRRDKMPESEFAQGLHALGVPQEALEPENVPDDAKEVLRELEGYGVDNAVFSPDIIRGFDYYTGMVFEVFDTHPDNRRSLFGGGRYDNLLALFDDEMVPAVGFGMGDVTVRDFLASRGLLPSYLPKTKVYIAVQSPQWASHAQEVAGELRAQGVNVAIDFGERKLQDQLHQASKHQIPYVIAVGQTEAQSNLFVVRDLRTGEEHPLGREQLASFFLTL